MWRAFFLAIGFYVILVGVQCLGVESVTLRIHDEVAAGYVSAFRVRRSKTGPLATDHAAAVGPLDIAFHRCRHVSLLDHHHPVVWGRRVS